MSEFHFFNKPFYNLNFKMLTSTEPKKAVTKPVSDINPLFSSLEAELNTRLELLDKTSLVTISDMQGTILYVNDMFCEISGFSRHEVIGKTHDIIRHTDLSDENIEGAMKMLRDGKTWRGIVKYMNKNKEIFWTRTTVSPVLDHEGIPFKLIWMRTDITDLKRTERELYSAKERADQRMLDNVKNAVRIQAGILPSEEELREILPAAYLINSPLLDVSGDFYWFAEQKDETIFVLGDGTGHGISASYISIMALTALKFIVGQNGETDPGNILTALNDFLYQSLGKHRNSGLSESADIAVCSYNKKTRRLRYAGAHSKIYLVRHAEVFLLDRDDISIGSVNKEAFSINSKSVFLEKGDRVFMMSDGFTDQIGGDKNKRIGSRQVRELLKDTAYYPVNEQKKRIEDFFLAWKGENEQTDDLSLLAFNIS
jgi:PAS domain S-box-containing protein